MAAQHSYSPYSHFRVGAALRLTNGEVVTGTNVENISYGLTICAERSALVSAVSQFGPGIRIEAVAVANLNDAASPPCGACRQVLAEFTGRMRRWCFRRPTVCARWRFESCCRWRFEMKLPR